MAQLEERPSAIRLRALEAYEVLSRSIDDLEAATAFAADPVGVPEPEPRVIDDVLACSAKLFRELSAFIDLEEFSLLPAVQSADAWGYLRSQALVQHHQSHFVELGFLSREQTEPIDPLLLATNLRTFATALRQTLDHEKDEILNADLLRDDVVGTDAD